MLTKEQKKIQLQLATDSIKGAKAIVFADFSGISDTDLKLLKRELRAQGAQMKVLKKRLLKLALDEAGIKFDPTQEERLLGTIFSEKELTEIASPLYKFSKKFKDAETSHFEVLDAYDGERGDMVGKEEFVMIASLPSRDVLLAMVMGGFSSPVRAFMSIVKQLSEQGPVEEVKEESKKEEAPAIEKTKEETPVAEEVVKTEEKVESDSEVKSEEAPTEEKPEEENKTEEEGSK